MNTAIRLSTTALCAILLLGCAAHRKAAWQDHYRQGLPVLGHRNWIVIADSAYPAQSGSGISTVYTGQDQIATVNEVLKSIAGSKHVKPVVYVDKELESVSEQDAPGIDAYRKHLDSSLIGATVQRAPHMDIIKKLDEAGKLFRVVILKTDMALPYTSVFIELDCKYWNAEKEARLRQALAK